MNALLAATTALLVETTSGGAALTTDPPVLQQVEAFGLASPVSDADAERLRVALSVDRLVTVTERREEDGAQSPVAVRVRFTERGRTLRRFTTTTAERFASDVAKLVERGPMDSAPAPRPTPPPPDPISRFGDAGTVEIGAGIGFTGSGTLVEYRDAEDSRSYGQRAIVSPYLGAFPTDGWEFTGRMSLESAVAAVPGDKQQYMGWSFGVAAAWLPRIGSIRAGPELGGGVILEQTTFRYPEIGALRLTGQGAEWSAGVVAKVPLGGSALLTVGSHFFSESVELKYHADQATGSIPGSSRHWGWVTTVGLSYWRRSE